MTATAPTAAPGETIDLISAVDRLVAERWPFFRQRLQDHASAGDSQRVTLASLQGTEGFGEQLGRFAGHYPGQDLRGIASLWVQWYLVTVWPPLAAASLLLGAKPQLDAGATALVIDEEGKPAGLALPATAPTGRAGVGLESLARDQAAPLLDNAAAAAGMSPRVPWSNAINVLGWFLDELDQLGEHEASMLGRDLLLRPRWSDGSRNPMHVPAGLSTSARPQRRVCCLRYRLDGVDYCGDCPISSRRRRDRSTQPNP